METKKEIFYLLQVAFVWALLGLLKSPLFFLPVMIILLGLPFPLCRKPMMKVWQQLGVITGKIVSPIVLSIIYYLGLSPLAVLRKLFGHDILCLKKPEQTNLKTIKEAFTLERFDDLW